MTARFIVARLEACRIQRAVIDRAYSSQFAQFLLLQAARRLVAQMSNPYSASDPRAPAELQAAFFSLAAKDHSLLSCSPDSSHNGPCDVKHPTTVAELDTSGQPDLTASTFLIQASC